MTGDPGRMLGVDLGDARIGLAVSDPLGLTAQPLDSLAARGPRKDVGAVCRLVEAHDVSTVVIGLPLLLSGEDGTRAAGARRFADRMRGRLPRLRVELWDERLTTVQAERTMVSGNVRRDKRKRAVDAMAAVLILQSFLEAHPAGGGDAAR